jgi:pimeloyl-ACP methyl ester carboxylesterase
VVSLGKVRPRRGHARRDSRKRLEVADVFAEQIRSPSVMMSRDRPRMMITKAAMETDWELREAGPPDGERTVLLLAGGMCSAGSYAEVMAEPALAGMRLVAATLPGHAGAPPPDDYSIENYARLTAELARTLGADVVVGFSMGASVALEMVASGTFKGPVVLLGISLSPKDEPAFFRAMVRLGSVLGGLPSAVLAKGAASMVKRIPVSPERQAELRDEFAKNVPQHMRHALREYERWLHRHQCPAERLCLAGVPTWVVHAEKGDGGLTPDERSTLEECPHAHLVTIPGSVFFMPNEVPERIAHVTLEAIGHAGSPAGAVA